MLPSRPALAQRILVVGVLLLSVLWPITTAWADGIRIDRAPASLEPGAEARISAAADGMARCELVLPGAGVSASADVGDAAMTTWRWTVPSDAKQLRGDATVECWRSASAAANAAPDVTERVPLVINGDPRAAGDVVDASGISVTTSDASPDAPKWTEKGQFWISLCGLVLTVSGLAFVWFQLRATRTEGRIARGATILQRYQDREFLRSMSAALRYVHVAGVGDCFDRLLLWRDAPSGETQLAPTLAGEPTPTMNDVRHVTSFFEELAALYNASSIDSELTKRFFPQLVVGSIGTYWWLIQDFRDGCLPRMRVRQSGVEIVRDGEWAANETDSYVEWEGLARTFLLANPKLLIEDPNPELWIVCVPQGGDDRSAYRALTLRLSSTRSDLTSLEHVFDTAALSQVEVPPTSVYCILPWWADPNDHKRCQQLAAAIHASIDADRSLAQIDANLTSHGR
jgi:hypothetical protein